MAKLYIFGIGGTGSRVFRSLTMLLAAGVDTNGYDIVPVIIDPDTSNADLTRNVFLLNKYMSIHSRLSFTGQGQNDFFKTSILQSVQNFTILIPNTNNKTFEQFIDLANMGVADQAMAEMLFSNKNLSSFMQVGFKGNPNMGSVVLNQIASSPQFEQLANTFVEGDKIFIISSIFGGTGASGFPLLLNTLRQNKNIPNAGVINHAEIGAISVLPYFSLEQDSNSEIDSTTFFSKARAALKYYQDNIQNINALYYIGDFPKKPYENVEGGSEQKNDAHLIEVLAATAVIDFCKNSFVNQGTSYRELGLNVEGDTLSLRAFPSSGMRKQIAYPLMKLALFAKSLVDDFDYVSSQHLKVNRNFVDNFYEQDFVSWVRAFLSDYKCWLSELKGNSPSFSPFNMDGELKDLVTDVKGKDHFWNKLNNDTFRSELNGASVKGKGPEDKFMDIYYTAANNIANNKYQF